MRTTDLIDSLVSTTERLGDLVARENVLLHQRRPHELAQHHAEKDVLTSTYEREMAELRRDPGLLKRANPDAVGRLRKATRGFQEALEEHRRLVQTAKSVTDRIIRNITEEVAKRDRPVAGYDAKASLRNHFGRQQRPVSLALNQVI
ncbi:MAG TPA: hypothetical protein VE631_10795 [Alphaproteobacteria bacterium]|nr:hypothetical protein [Alphaproteobacteria bacterium]